MHLMSFRRAALALAILASLAACDRTAPATQAETPKAEAPVAATTSGIDLAGIDKAVAPGDDFNAYANGAWDKSTQIPDDRTSTGVFLQVFQVAEKRTSDLIQGLEKANPAAGSNERKIADYYAAFMDEAGIEQRGLAPLQAKLDGIDAIADGKALSAWLGGSIRADTDPLVDVGAKDITAHVDFTAIALAGQDAGLAVLGYTSQAHFLFNCGFGALLEAAAGDVRTLAHAQKLVTEHEMGELFKVIGFVAGPSFDAIGFRAGDRTHRL